MSHWFRCVVVVLAVSFGAPALRASAGEPVDLLLVLAADVSRSVDSQKFQLQREGYAAALANPRVIDAIHAGRHGRIGVLLLEWSGFGNQKVVIDWMVVDGPKTAQAFGDRLLESPRSFADRTSISGGIDAAVAQLAKAPFNADRRTIDVSGDGTNNAGRDVAQARDEALALGITINGLVILSETPLPWKSRAHEPAGRARQILPRQCQRRARQLRAGGQGLQFIRAGDHQKNDRGNCRCPPKLDLPTVGLTDGPRSHERVTEPIQVWRQRSRCYSPSALTRTLPERPL